ncbi:LAME_0G10242g1_1 [Lachancea meyersii CBS 8951]|uniref:LAME_0G10242g1_1 n=1 Tax=Lachancea meyersii CBS 8951 TaxID=1266667 RepID=A0A1G4K905_9SACH|nr:LAME_0G10242g1_1 [Lachancea meyersii CBS 8951]
MCILLASSAHPKYSLILISNRDEFYERETQHTSLDQDGFVLCPIDLALNSDGTAKRGTWCGANKDGKIAVVLNLRHNGARQAGTCANPVFSRGSVPMRFLNDRSPFNEWNSFEKFAHKYPLIRNGDLNLFVGDCKNNKFTAMDSFGLSLPVLTAENPYLVISNDFIDSDNKWPKRQTAENLLRQLVTTSSNALEDQLIDQCLKLASNSECDENGDILKEQLTTNSIFIPPLAAQSDPNAGATLQCGKYYGTRSQIVILVSRSEPTMTFVERVLHDSDNDASAFSPAHPKQRVMFKMSLESDRNSGSFIN